MIEELKRQLDELDNDLAPVLRHVEAANERREALVKAIAAADVTEKSVAKHSKPKPKPKAAEPDTTGEAAK